jgi:hypothetical protein
MAMALYHPLLDQGIDPDDHDDLEEEEHPYNCICPECAYWEWLLYEDRQDPLDDENWEPPF